MRRSAMRLATAVGVLGVAGGAGLAGATEERDGSAYHATANPDEPDRLRSMRQVVERLIVTARKREELPQQVPVAVTAFRAEELQGANRDRRLEDLQGRVPSLIFDTAVGFSSAQRLVLRGLGEGDPTPTSDPGVGVYVDGIYLARSTGLALTPFDVERVEVLRGPQGTLFGKNTTGGAINVFTRKPELDFGGEVSLRVGNFDTVESRAALNLPLVAERAMLRVSLASATSEGYVKNAFTGDDLADNKLLGGRAQLLLFPSDDVEVLLGYGYSRENRSPLGGKCVVLGPGKGLGGLVARQSGALDACRRDAARSELKIASDFDSARDSLITQSATAHVTWDITPDLTLLSLTGFRRTDNDRFGDLDFTPVALLQSADDRGREQADQWSQELQLTGRAWNDRLRYVTGLYALRDGVDSLDSATLGFLPVSARRIAENPLATRNDLEVDNWSYAIYGQTVYALTPRLDLTLGARFTAERKRVKREVSRQECRAGASERNCAALRRLPLDFSGFERSARFSNVSPMASLSYAWSPRVLVYASYGSAFLSGGFQGRARQASDTNELDPQDLKTYEIGLKSTFLEDRLLLNASYFYNILEDSRISFTSGTDALGLPGVSERNAARTVIRGGEVELGVVPSDGLQLGASIGVLRSEFEKFSDDVPDRSIGANTPPGTPNYTMSFTADYTRPLAGGTLALHTAWSHRGTMQSDAQATKALEAGKVGVLDGRIAWTMPDGRTELSAYGTNLLDRRYFTNGVSLADSLGLGARFFAPPRRYGIEIRRRF